MGLLLRGLILFICIIAIVKFIEDDVFDGNIDVITSLSIQDWVGLFLLTLLSYVCLSLMFRESMVISKCDITMNLSFRLSAMNNFLNTFLPLKGGAVARGVYLKNRFNFQWRDYGLVLVFSLFLNIAILMVFLFASSIEAFSLTLFQLLDHVYEYSFYIMIVVVVASVSLFLFKEKISYFIRYFVKSANLWLLRPGNTFRYILYSITFHSFSIVRLGVSFTLVGAEVTYTELIAIYCLLSMGMSVSVTPGNLGVKELSLVMIASFFSIEAALSFNAAIIDRISGLAVSLLVGGACSYSLSKESWYGGKS